MTKPTESLKAIPAVVATSNATADAMRNGLLIMSLFARACFAGKSFRGIGELPWAGMFFSFREQCPYRWLLEKRRSSSCGDCRRTREAEAMLEA
jgi:hypothetical protein